MIKAILFDKDGTLIEFTSTWHQIMALVFDMVADELGCEESVIESLKRCSGYQRHGFIEESIIQFKSTREIISIWINQVETWEQDMKPILMDIFERAAIHQSIHVDLLEGTWCGLTYLKERGYALGIATADTRDSAIHGLKQAGIYDFFSFIGADDGEMIAKPDRDMAQRFCALHEIKPEELLIVGDSINDWKFAQQSGAVFAGIQNAYGSLVEAGLGSVPLVSDMQELIKEFGL